MLSFRFRVFNMRRSFVDSLVTRQPPIRGRKAQKPVALVVEPQPELAAVLVRALEAIGMKVIAASSHHAAMQLASDFPPLLLVSCLPPPDRGDEQGRLVKLCPRHTRTIILASDDSVPLPLPPNTFVLWKPIGWEDLKTAVERSLNPALAM